MVLSSETLDLLSFLPFYLFTFLLLNSLFTFFTFLLLNSFFTFKLSHNDIEHHHQHETYGETYGAEIAVFAA